MDFPHATGGCLSPSHHPALLWRFWTCGRVHQFGAWCNPGLPNRCWCSRDHRGDLSILHSNWSQPLNWGPCYSKNPGKAWDDHGLGFNLHHKKGWWVLRDEWWVDAGSLLFGPILHLGFYFEAVWGCVLDPVDAFDKSELRIWQGFMFSRFTSEQSKTHCGYCK